MGYRNSLTLSRLTLVIAIFALIFQLVGFFCPYWLVSKNRTRHFLLWKSCLYVPSYCDYMEVVGTQYEAPQILSIIGLMSGIVGVLNLILFLFLQKELLSKVGCGGVAIASLFMFVSIAVIGGKRNYFNQQISFPDHFGYDIGWAMIVFIFGAFLYVIATGLTIRGIYDRYYKNSHPL